MSQIKRTVSFGRVEVIKIQKYKKYNKPYHQKLIQEGNEDFDCGCNCVLF